MKKFLIIIVIFLLSSTSCTSPMKLSYLNKSPEFITEDIFTMKIPDYKIQIRDILYITIKSMTTDGSITDLLISSRGYSTGAYIQGDAGSYLYGYDVDSKGMITIPVVGNISVAGLTLEQTRTILQESADKIFINSTVECKLLSFKFTVIGEVRTPGTYVNFNNYLTVLEAVGRAGGIGDYGNRSNVLVIRTVSEGTKTYSINLQDKNILSSEAYFLLPNDVVIVQPLKHKIFNMNLPTLTFIMTSITSAVTTTILLINYLK